MQVVLLAEGGPLPGRQPRLSYSPLVTAVLGGIVRQTVLPPRNPCKIDLRYNCISWPRGDTPHRAGHPDQKQDLGHGLACLRRLMLEPWRVGLYGHKKPGDSTVFNR